MKINLDAVLKDQNNIPVQGDKGGVFTTLGYITCTALLAQFPDDRADGAEKHRRYKLWTSIKDGGEQDITAEDITMIKKLIGMGWAALIVGQCWELLEGRSGDEQLPTAS